MPSFEVFRRTLRPADAYPTVTFHSRGMSLNVAAMEALGAPAAVELLFDRDAQVVGIRPTAAGSETAHTLRRPLKANGGGEITAQSFTTHYEIAVTPAHRRRAEMADGILCIDLTQPGFEVTSNRRATP